MCLSPLRNENWMSLAVTSRSSVRSLARRTRRMDTGGTSKVGARVTFLCRLYCTLMTIMLINLALGAPAR